ncbi:hypothetical protein EDD18DRAFT_1098003 [Armillaria luteobubalina]|uniref:Uncharacterized protein n=1 Tax=Armillaria luteobubalina TaxID=153913 RepID=A0AA39UWZ7_9AGAR|nr:hypothetical protein EDD18DRAFT_1098003 [Armillaria luteobubalina]
MVPSPPAVSADIAPSKDQSLSPSPMPSPQYELVPTLNDVEDTNGDDLLLTPHIDNTTKSDDMADNFGPSRVSTRASLTTDGFNLMDVGDIDIATNVSSESEYQHSESDIDAASLKQIQDFLKLRVSSKLSKKSVSYVKGEPGSTKGNPGNAKGKTTLDIKGKKKKTPAKCKDEQLEICYAIIAECNEAPKAVIELKLDPRVLNPKNELRGLAKDWHCVLIQAYSVVMSLFDCIEMPADPQALEIVLEEADMQEIDIKEHVKKSNWKNKDLPFENFICDLPIWQQKFVPSLVNWATWNIQEPYGTTNHPDFKVTVQDLWAKIFLHLSLKLKDDSAQAEHPTIQAVAAAAIQTHCSDIDKEALKTMDRNWNLTAGLAIAASAVWCLPLFLGCSDFSNALYLSNSKNNSNSFKDNSWGSIANKYFPHLAGYNNGKWKEIILESAKYLNTKKIKSPAVERGLSSADADEILDGDDNITLSLCSSHCKE